MWYSRLIYKNFGVERYKHFVLTNPETDAHVIKGMTIDHNYHGYIALDKGILIGMIIYMAPNYIRKIAVKSGFCHQGVGSALLEMVEDDITSKEVVVHAAAPAVDFYLKNGYKKMGELNEETYPYYPMKKEFR